jgi:nicotine blue oxidoreductase
MIAGIVLAAGRSSRMGEPKALLRVGGRSFLEHAVTALAAGGCEPVLVVTAPHSDPVAASIAAQATALGARVAVNPGPGEEQVDSLRAGIRALDEDCEAALVLPVDVPGVDAGLARALIAAFRAGGAPLVQPCDGVRHGHPVLVARPLWAELLSGPLPEGMRSLSHAHAAERAERAGVEVGAGLQDGKLRASPAT